MSTIASETISPARGAMIVGLVGLVAVLSDFLPIISLPLLILAWILSLGSVLVFPAIYYLTARFGMRHAHYPGYVAVAVLIMAGLNCWYLHGAWDYGMKWQGAPYTYSVAALSFTYFGLIGAAAVLGVYKNSIKAAELAHLGLMIVLSFGAFPVLGELP